MLSRHTHLPGAHLEPAQAALRAAILFGDRPAEKKTSEPLARPFVTVSRQPGAGAISFSHKLADRLNSDGSADWMAWDRELVQKVSTEYAIAREIVEAIQESRHNWLGELLQSFSIDHDPPNVAERRAYKRVAMAVYSLAKAGHAIIVGQGGVFITRNLPGAIHLRLIAPLEHRIKTIADSQKLPLHKAAERINKIDLARSEFYRRYWPGKVIAPETFAMTLNCAELSVDELVECALPLVNSRQANQKCPAPSERLELKT